MKTVKKSSRLQRAEAKTKKRVKRAHDKAERKGEKVVAKRRVLRADNPRFMKGGVDYENVYQRELEEEYKGIIKGSKIRQTEEKKVERKAKRKGKAPRGFGVTKKVKPPRGGGRAQHVKPKKTRGARVAKKCGEACRRKIRASGGGAQK